MAKREASQEVLKSGTVVSGELQNETAASALAAMNGANHNAAKAANKTKADAAVARDVSLRCLCCVFVLV